MALPSSYFTSTKNLSAMLEQMRKAQVPPRFTYDHLKQMGFPSSNDRPIIPILKVLGFLDQAGVPSERYRRLKGTSDDAKRAIADGLREAYTDVFALDENAHTLSGDELKGIFGRLSGKGDSVTEKMATTFRALVDQADFSAPVQRQEVKDEGPTDDEAKGRAVDGEAEKRGARTLTLRHDVHVHLPVSDDIKVYDAIFRSMRENLLV
jgi:Family of unknown function (DUF5343)